MHKYQTLIDALALEPTSALFMHPRDDNKWKENERFAIACEPEVIRSLLEDNERLRDALQELVESHLEKFPVFEAGISAQQAPAQPVARVVRFNDLGGEIDWTGRTICPVGSLLYTAPPAQAQQAAGVPDASVLVEALRKIQYKAVSLGDAQVIALEALAAPTAPAQVPTDPNQCDVCGAQRKS